MTANASKEPASGAMTALIVFKVHFVMLSLFTIFVAIYKVLTMFILFSETRGYRMKDKQH